MTTPSYATRKTILAALCASNLAAIALLWWHGSGTQLAGGGAGALVAIGRLAGLLLEAALLLQLILISRISFIEKTYGFDTLLSLHKKVGYILAATLILHPLLLTVGYASLQNISLVDQFKGFITVGGLLPTLIGFLILLGVAVGSTPWIRRHLKYHYWRVTHLLAYLGLFLIFGHQLTGTDLGAGWPLAYWLILNNAVFGLLVAYRALLPFAQFFRHRFTVTIVKQESQDAWSVTLTGKNMDCFAFEAGQFLHVSFMQKGLREPHPFSFSQAWNGRDLRITIKTSGDYTSRIKELRVGTHVLIEGPFGRFTERSAHTKKFLFIAGGIGVTPIRALIESLSSKKSDMHLMYAARTAADLVFKSELEQWTKPTYILSASEDPTCEYGYCDKEKIMRLVPDFLERDIYICGPEIMMKSVVTILLELGVPKAQIHHEKFGY